jgi:DNA-binding MarR family transcriptional regulator
MENPVIAVERAMVTIRRMQTRRTLSRSACADPTVVAVLDAVEGHVDQREPASVSGVASALAVDQPRASRLVARAVADGWLSREADQADGRRASLRLTEAGTNLLAQVHRHRQDVFATAMADWPAERQVTFAQLLTEFVEAYQGVALRR